MSLKRFRMEKLIRDHLPDVMRSKGIVVHERSMEQEEFIVRLKDKLQEEVAEVQQAKNLEELTEELADVLEVIQNLSKAAGITLEQIEKTCLEKRLSKGGFEKKVFVSFVDIDESNPSIEYYIKKTDVYPLIKD